VTWLFIQTWIWHLVAFLLGALITWLLFAQPWRRQRAAGGAVAGQDAASAKELAAAREQVVTLKADLETCRKNRAAEADATGRELVDLRSKLASTEAPSRTAGTTPATVSAAEPARSEPATLLSTGGPKAAGGPKAREPKDADGSKDQGTSVAAGSTTATVAPRPYGAGSAATLPGGSAPAGYTIKGNADSGLFHTVDSPWYGRTKAEAWFDTEESATAAGFTHWKRRGEKKK
jgi:hypothetical protein